MRALNLVGLLAFSIVVGCGGESAGDDEPSELGDAGEDGNGAPKPPSGSAGDDGNGNGSAGEGAGGTTGGKSGGGGTPGTGAAPSKGGAPGAGGGSTAGSPGIPAGGSPPRPPPSMGGVGGTPSIPPIEGCEPSSQSSSTGYCQLGLTCENAELYTDCKDGGGGSWYCYCQSNFGSQSYTITGAVGMAACETVSEICASGEPPEFSGPEECVPIAASRAVNYCDLQEQCSRPLAIDSDVGSVVSSRYVNCSSDGTGALTCSCQNGLQYRVEGMDGTTACDELRDFCGEDAAAPFDEPAVCMPTSQSSGPNYCDSSYQCTQSAEVAKGIYAIRNDYSFASCQTLASGGSTCTCQNNTTAVQFDYESGALEPGTCNLAAELCGQTDSLELSGAIECSQASQSAQATYCNANLDCTQQGTLGGEAVKVHGSLSASCQANGDTWFCSCQSGTETATLDLPTTGVPWDDCTAAADQCLELIDVQIGTIGGPIGRPAPVPF
jgi:hypothetical protein